MAKKSKKNNRHNNVVNPFFDDNGGPKNDWHPLDDQIDGRRDKK